MSRHSIAECISLACLLEATAPKPGNVHRGADFEDLSFVDFLVAGTAIAAPLAQAATIGVGPAILNAVRATKSVCRTNVNLGIILLLAPAAAVPREEPLETGVPRVLSALGPSDAAAVWEAIRTANPGGLGNTEQDDVSRDPPPHDLLEAMRTAAARDRVAYQYANGFVDIFERVVPLLVASRQRGNSLTQAIVETHLRLLSELPDTLIARKCGEATAREASTRAASVLAAGGWHDDDFHAALADFDFWLRADGHNRNPGTTADLMAAGLFMALRDDLIEPPYI